MREILVSTDVFAKIWASRQEGENSEDEILRRAFGCEPVLKDFTFIQKEGSGFFDSRNNVLFPEGFEIFRIYNGKDYKARVSNGKWVRLDTNDGYDSLNQLSAAIFNGNVNAWVNWNYRDENNQIHQISNLRDQSKIPKRQKRPTAFDFPRP